MNSKERVFTILNHEEADRVPRFNWFAPDISKKLRNIFDINDENIRDLDLVFEHDLIVEFLGVISPWVRQITNPDLIPGDQAIFKDAWGIEYKGHIDKSGGSYPMITSHPLLAAKDLSNYIFPSIDKDVDFNDFNSIVAKYKKDFPIMAAVTSTVFEGSWFLRGFDNFLNDLLLEPEFAEELMDKVLDFNLSVALKAIELGADIIWLGDDVGMETGMIISPEMWRKFLKPRYGKIIEKLKSANKEIIIAYHTDGYIEPIIPDFIEIGLDILNSLQPNCNNLTEVKKRYGSKLTFWGGIDVQNAIPFGDAGKVIKEVKERISQLAENGGYIICSSNGIEPSERVIENIFTYYWALEKYGKYPLNIS
jgi:uroporphyrinogen decarboxylase